VFSLSLWDVELLLAERGVIVSDETVCRWCEKFGQIFTNRPRRRRPRPGDKWHMDEMFIRIQGVRYISGVPWIGTASCSISSFTHGGMPKPPNAFSRGR
jgi:hypothetical protein